jgi:hypothetical protein
MNDSVSPSVSTLSIIISAYDEERRLLRCFTKIRDYLVRRHGLRTAEIPVR